MAVLTEKNLCGRGNSPNVAVQDINLLKSILTRYNHWRIKRIVLMHNLMFIRNVNCPGQSIRKSQVFIILLFISNMVYAQDCVIHNLGDGIYHIKKTGLIGQLYDSIKGDKSNAYHIVLFRTFQQMNRKDAFYLCISPDKTCKVMAITEDSVLIDRFITESNKCNFDSITGLARQSCYLISECKNMSSHQTSVLLVCNQSLKKWIEYTSIDGYMKRTLDRNGDYGDLKYVYDLIATIFKRENVYKEE